MTHRRSIRGLFAGVAGWSGLVLCMICGSGCREPSTPGGTDGRTPPARAVATTPATGEGNTATSSSAPAASAGLALPRTNERRTERLRMVEQQIAGRGIRDPLVLEAMRNVPRHWFVPEAYCESAYEDSPLPIGHSQTISQPYIVAVMTELLELKRGDKVLEIGTGSGYQAAILAELTDEVYTIEIVEPLGQRATAVLKDRGYHEVRVRIGDGYRGWPEAAPFDAIIVTCAPDKPPPPLVEQLAVGGRMCIPVDVPGGDQELIQLHKKPDGTLEQRRVEWVRFVPMTGEAKDRRD
jgi:protein-L-isoaspartate(D-aspartate) O-methyltransferase